MSYRRVKRDANHAEIARAFEACGCSVLDLAKQGAGVPDLAIGYQGRTYFVEVKHPKRAGKKGGANQNATMARQAEFARTWKGGPVSLATSVDDVPRLLHEWAALAVGVAYQQEQRR